MRSGTRDKKVRAALAGSLILHGIILAFLIHQKYVVHSAKKGTISVDLIETVRHQPEPLIKKGPGHAKPTFRPPQPEQQPVPPQAVNKISADAPEMQAYILAVLKEINKRKVYPLAALDRGEEGKVVVGVSVGAGGQVLDVRVEEPSAFVRLNQAAVDTVKNIPSLPPLPAAVAPPVHLHIPLVYRVENH